MLIRLAIIFFILINTYQVASSQTILFEEDFGTSHSSSYMWANWCSSDPTDNSYGADCGDGLTWWVYGTGKYAKSTSISIPATGTTELNFEYKFNKFGSFPTVEVSTSGCYGTYTSVNTLTYQGSCTSVSVDLSGFSGQSINIAFVTHKSDGTFILDNVVVTNTAGGSGGGPDLKWADNFNDNNLDINYAGNDGDEQFSGQSWDIGTASLVSGSATVNKNKTEAFPNNDAQAYSVHIDKDEYFESPTIDLSAQEGFKISFYVDIAGGAYSDWYGSHVDLKIWDGSSWVLALQLDGNSSDSEDLMASGFGYHCFTAYKSSTSPGNYYPNLTVNPSFFHSNFKFKFEIQGWGSVAANIDNVTFRADDDGESLIPCGVSFWNTADAIHYGKDPLATSSNHSWRGMELEIDDMWNVGTPPDWAAHCNDGNQGNGTANTIVWAVISEQQISSARAKVNFIHSDGTTGIENKTMSEDASYTGPGYLYYYKQLSQCNSSNSSFYDTGQGLEYHFLFEYGTDFRPVYYHLNTTGIEAGGGKTDLSENNNPEICDVWLPVELISFEGEHKQEGNILTWATASELNNSRFEIERSNDALTFEYIGELVGNGNSNLIHHYKFIDNKPLQKENYYRLKQVDFDGNWIISKNILIKNSFIDPVIRVKKDVIEISFNRVFTGQIKVFDSTGQLHCQTEVDDINISEISMRKTGLFIVQIISKQNIPYSEKVIVN